jgi:hypothetical protein
MKDGRTHLAHKAEHAVDLETGAIVGVTVQDADDGDTETSIETLIKAAEQIEIVRPGGDGLQEVVGDKGYHSNQSLVDLEVVGIRSYISEPDRGRRNWKKKPDARAAVYRNRRRIRGPRGLRLLRLRGERLERPFAHLYETGGMRRAAPARAHEHSEATADPHRRFQSRPADAATDRCRHAAGPAGAVPPRGLGHTRDPDSAAVGVGTTLFDAHPTLFTNHIPSIANAGIARMSGREAVSPRAASRVGWFPPAS